MAMVAEYWGKVAIGDSRQQVTDFRVRLLDADAAAWLAAIGFPAKQATEAGQLMDAVAGLSAGTPMSYAVESSYVDDAAAFPAADDNVYNFDKINVGFRAGLDRYTVTIPSRDDTAYNVADDGVTVIISGAGASAATLAFVTAFNTSVEGKNGSAGTVEKMYISR
jgi:archaellum component FlaG (FlaF/FlaG flagellin family)